MVFSHVTDHPDREQYKQYEEQWKQYEVQMDTQKAELAKRRQAVLDKCASEVSQYPALFFMFHNEKRQRRLSFQQNKYNDHYCHIGCITVLIK